MNDIQYKAQADSINVEDITTNTHKRSLLRRLQVPGGGDVVTDLSIQSEHGEGSSIIDYVPEDINDIGWLGYFIGKSEHLKNLFLYPLVHPGSIDIESLYKALFRGVNNNKSIESIEFRGTDLLGGKIFTMLGPFFKNNYSLNRLCMSRCVLADEGCRAIALALGSISSKTLTKVSLQNNLITDEALADIIGYIIS